jgi:NitT/TauT family transport system substrate-binding protein
MVTMLAGLYIGCFELFAKDGINSVADLKGRSVGTPALEPNAHVFLSAMAALVGLDTTKDIKLVTSADPKPIELFLDGKVDAFLGFPPEPQRLRAQNVGNVIVNNAQDRPWSQYFCCMLGATPSSRGRSRSPPSAWCARFCGRPVSASTRRPGSRGKSSTRGFTPNYDYAVQTLSDVPYEKWRDYDPEDTIRFYALRLHEAE